MRMTTLSLPSNAAGGMSQLDRIEAKLDRLQASLDLLPDFVATLANTFDDLAADEGEAYFDERVRRALVLLVRLGDPELLGSLERLLDPKALRVLADATHELHNAASAPPEEHRLLGLLTVLRETEVQRTTSFLVHFLRRVGRALSERDNGEEPQ